MASWIALEDGPAATWGCHSAAQRPADRAQLGAWRVSAVSRRINGVTGGSLVRGLFDRGRKVASLADRSRTASGSGDQAGRGLVDPGRRFGGHGSSMRTGGCRLRASFAWRPPRPCGGQNPGAAQPHRAFAPDQRAVHPSRHGRPAPLTAGPRPLPVLRRSALAGARATEHLLGAADCSVATANGIDVFRVWNQPLSKQITQAR